MREIEKMKIRVLLPIILFLYFLAISSPVNGQSQFKFSKFKCDLTYVDRDLLQLLLSSAISANDENCVKELLELKADPNLNEIKGNTYSGPIFVTAWNGRVNILKLLLQAGLEVKNDYGNASLSMAIQNGHLEMVEMLLDAGADINNKRVVLNHAARKGNVKMVEALLKRSANVNLANEMGITSLMESADNPQIVEDLIKAGAKIEAFDNKGWTAIFYAIKYIQLKKLEILLKNGANTNIQDIKGMTPIKLAQKIKKITERKKVITLLKSFEPNISNSTKN